MLDESSRKVVEMLKVGNGFTKVSKQTAVHKCGIVLINTFSPLLLLIRKWGMLTLYASTQVDSDFWAWNCTYFKIEHNNKKAETLHLRLIEFASIVQYSNKHEY